MVAILLQEDVGKEPTTWWLELKNSAFLLRRPQGGKWVASHPQAHGEAGRARRRRGWGVGREEIERERMGKRISQLVQSPIQCLTDAHPEIQAPCTRVGDFETDSRLAQRTLQRLT